MAVREPIWHPDSIDVAVGARVKIRRKQLGISQTGLATAIGITFQQVQKYERGSNRISASALAKIAIALDAPVGAFFERDEISEPLFASLATPGASDLLTVFAGISRADQRRALIAVARALANIR